MSFDYKVKIIVLGETGVGKTSLLLRFCTKTFKVSRETIAVDIKRNTVEIDGKKVLLEIWDTGGQDRFKSIIKNYYRTAHGVLLVYDVTKITSFHKLSSWLDELRYHNEEAQVIIVGNKIDDETKRNVSVNTIRSYAEQEGLNFIEASAKTGDNVEEIFHILARLILESSGVLTSSSSTADTSSSLPPPVKPKTINNNKVTTAEFVNLPPPPPDTEDPEKAFEVEVLINDSTTKSISDSTSSHQNDSTSDEQIRIETVPKSVFVSQSRNSLPPIVSLPPESIQLHVEVTKESKKKSSGGCC